MVVFHLYIFRVPLTARFEQQNGGRGGLEDESKALVLCDSGEGMTGVSSLVAHGCRKNIKISILCIRKVFLVSECVGCQVAVLKTGQVAVPGGS